jgi:isoquinoline 1-oxidoreductase
MSEQHLGDFFCEPERYELFAGWLASLTPNRRDFLRVGGGLVVALLVGEAAAQQPGGGRQRPGGAPLPQEIGAWLHVAEDSAVTVFTGKVEVGQNIRTSLTQVVAEELRIAPGRIRLVMADTAQTPYDFGTAGSRTTPDMAARLRRVGAAARELLLDMAAEEARVDRASLSAADGKVAGPRGTPSFEFGRLTKGKKLVKLVDDKAPLTPPERWVVAGTSLPKVDGRAFVTGGHHYASDVHRPGMLFGKVLRPPAFKAKLLSLETADAEKVPGVVVAHDGDFVGVAAPTEQTAERGLAALRAKWQTTPQPSSDELFDYLKSHPAAAGGRGFGGPGRREQGSVKDGLAAADKTLKATYTIAYIAHTPLEPRAAVAEWAGEGLTVWTGTQMPFRVRQELAGAFSLAPERVRVVAPDTGSGYGGKHTGETAVEAARLAKAAGKPVKLVWTREEEFTWAYFRPGGVIDVAAGVKGDGTLTAWEFHNYNSGGSALAPPYEVANLHLEFHPADSPLRQGSYRALASTANNFARESHLDDLAHAVGIDPLAFRRKVLKDARVRAVLEAAAGAFGWGKVKPAAGHGFGLACGTEKGGYVAACADVAVDRAGGAVRVERVVTAFECGAVLNPDHLKNQIEGAALMALGGALFEEVKFKDGRVLNANFAGYRVPRFRDAPVLETVLVNRTDLPAAGAGECPMIALAPAVGNAIFQATGVRLRSLPMVPNGFKAT